MKRDKFFTGIGSRKTPESVLEKMGILGTILTNEDYILRSGGAGGADSAFEMGALNKQIFLPWKGFNGHPSKFYKPSKLAFKIASMIHPYWEGCSPGVRKLHARNVHQVLGPELESPSEFVIYWAPYDLFGVPKGGTATAVNLAKRLSIPTYNLNIEKEYNDCINLIKTIDSYYYGYK